MAKLAALLKQAEKKPAPESFSEAMFLLERLGQKAVTTEEREKYLQNFRSTVETLRDLARTQQDASQELKLCLRSGQTCALLGLWPEAKSYYEDTLALSQKTGELGIQAKSLRLLGNLQMQQHQIKAALSKLEQSRKICREQGELLEEARALNSMAAAYFQTAEWRKMERVSNEALAIAESLQEKELAGLIYNNLGAMYSVRGKWEKALLAFQKSVPIFERVGDNRRLAETYNNMATLFRDKEVWQEAGECFARSLQLASKVGDVVVKASATLNRVELYLLMHDLDMAEFCCREALHTFQQLGKDLGVADACRLQGVIYTRQKKWQLAGKSFEKALQLNTKHSNLFGLAETHRELAELSLAQNHRPDALVHLKKALEHYQALKATKEIQKLRRRIISLQPN